MSTAVAVDAVTTINQAIEAVVSDHERVHCASKPSGRGLPRGLSKILIGPSATISFGIHAQPAAWQDYQRWTQTLQHRGITPVWIVTDDNATPTWSPQLAERIHCGQITGTEATITDGDQQLSLDEVMVEIVAGTAAEPAVASPAASPIEDAEPLFSAVVAESLEAFNWSSHHDPRPDFDPEGFIDASTGEFITHPWCPVCQAPRSRVERSGHVVREVLAESAGVIIDAELFVEVDQELGTEVFTESSAEEMDQVLDRFVDYGWGRIDDDGDILRTTVTAVEPVDPELREMLRGKGGRIGR